MLKADYSEVRKKISDLFYTQIDLSNTLTMIAPDRTCDEYGRPISEWAGIISRCWFEDRKTEVLAESGWGSEAYDAADEEETRKFYEDLENSPEAPIVVGEFVHDSGEEDEADLEFFEERLLEISMN